MGHVEVVVVHSLLRTIAKAVALLSITGRTCATLTCLGASSSDSAAVVDEDFGAVVGAAVAWDAHAQLQRVRNAGASLTQRSALSRWVPTSPLSGTVPLRLSATRTSAPSSRPFARHR